MKAREVIREHFWRFEDNDLVPSEAEKELLRALADAGYAIVPIQPSEKMLKVGADEAFEWTAPEADWMHDDLRAAWKAMLQAAREE